MCNKVIIKQKIFEKIVKYFGLEKAESFFDFFKRIK
jgi:hypothetical protein